MDFIKQTNIRDDYQAFGGGGGGGMNEDHHFGAGGNEGGASSGRNLFEEQKVTYNYAVSSSWRDGVPKGKGGKDSGESANLLNMSGFQSEIIQKLNIYAEITVSGPKWSKDGG